LLLLAFPLLHSCKKDIENRNPSLLIYPNSKNIHFHVSGSVEQISFITESQYPAESIIEWITRGLEFRGWHPLKESFLNPGIPSSITQGWESFMDRTTEPNQRVHQWIADWSNSSGDILTYGLQYKYSEKGEKNLKTLFVFGNYTPKEIADETLEIIKQQNNL
jgi:hypothetical protein